MQTNSIAFVFLYRYNTQVAFAALDSNLDGHISKEELESGFTNFFMSYKYNSSVLTFGPIYNVKIVPKVSSFLMLKDLKKVYRATLISYPLYL